jgi:uncharacterized protein with von Willebrand factor type A (vWA) domain
MAGSTKQRSAAKSPSDREAKTESRDVGRLEERTRVELFELARRLDVAGYADMSKAELVEAIRRR